MVVNKQPLTDKDQTAGEIKKIVDRFYTDLNNIFIEKRDGRKVRLSDVSLQRFFDLVRRIP